MQPETQPKPQVDLMLEILNDFSKKLSYISQKVDMLNKSMIEKDHVQEDPDKLFTVDELCEYLPEKKARQTVYGLVNNRHIPFEKHGKYLYFRKSIIDAWMNQGRPKKMLKPIEKVNRV